MVSHPPHPPPYPGLVLHLPADVLEVALSKELDEEVADRVVGRGPVPIVLCAGALVVVTVLVAARDALVVLAATAVVGSPGDDRPREAETARQRPSEVSKRLLVLDCWSSFSLTHAVACQAADATALHPASQLS